MADLRVASSQSKEDRDRQHALDRAQQALRDLTANLMRISRGAGWPAEVLDQAIAYCEASQAHWDVARRYLGSEEVAAALSLDQEELFAQLDSENRALPRAERHMVNGALQVAASRLLGQKTQDTRGSQDLLNGKRHWDEALKALNAAWDLRYKVEKPPKPPRKPKR